MLNARYFVDARTVFIRQWGEDLVAFNSRFATTHLLSAGGAEALKALLDVGTDCTSLELGRRMFLDERADSDQPDLATEELAALERMVAELVHLGLVESRSK